MEIAFVIVIAVLLVSLVAHFTIKSDRGFINDLTAFDQRTASAGYVSSNAHRNDYNQ